MTFDFHVRQMLLNLHKKSWMEGLTLQDYSEHCKLNETIVKEMLELAKNYNKVKSFGWKAHLSADIAYTKRKKAFSVCYFLIAKASTKGSVNSETVSLICHLIQLLTPARQSEDQWSALCPIVVIMVLNWCTQTNAAGFLWSCKV